MVQEDMSVIHAQIGTPIDHIFATTAVSHEDDPDTHHHHNYEFDMEATITKADGGVVELYNAVGLHEGEMADKTIIIAMAIDDPVILGVGTHQYEISATDVHGSTILNESGTIVVTDGTPAPPREVRPWDLLNPNSNRSSKTERDSRMDICLGCPKLVAGICQECLCLMRWKTTLKDAYCPIGKW